MIFMVIWNFELPYIAREFILALKSLALFEFIPTKEILVHLNLACEGDCEDTPDGAKIGIQRLRSSDYWFQNGGPFLIGGCLFIIVCLIVGLLVKKDSLARQDCIQKLLKKADQKIYYSAIIRYVQTSSIKLHIAQLTNLTLAYSSDEIDSSYTGMGKQLIAILIIAALLLNYYHFNHLMEREKEGL